MKSIPSKDITMEEPSLEPTTLTRPSSSSTSSGGALTLQAVKDLLKPMDDRITAVLKTQMEMKATIGEAATLKSENEKLKQRVMKMEEINCELNRRLTNLENRLLESNIILTGVREGVWETDEDRKEMIYEIISDTVLGRTFDEQLLTAKTMLIRSSRRLGRYSAMYNRPILVEFATKEDAEYLLTNRTYLPRGIFIDREYSKETEAKRKILCPYFRAARKLPRYHGKCRLDGDKLIINGNSFSTDDLHKLPADLNGENISSISDQNSYGFFGRLHPFSNFFEASFEFQGLKYHSTEQMIQHLKAIHLDDENTAEKILAAETPLECKQLARDIENYNNYGWNSIAKSMCVSGIKCKFDQNP